MESPAVSRFLYRPDYSEEKANIKTNRSAEDHSPVENSGTIRCPVTISYGFPHFQSFPCASNLQVFTKIVERQIWMRRTITRRS
jgi:hypothetical protein